MTYPGIFNFKLISIQKLTFGLAMFLIAAFTSAFSQEDLSQKLLTLEDKIILGEEEAPFSTEELIEARKLVDLAIGNEEYRTQPQSWYLRGTIYAKIFWSQESLPGISRDDALQQVKEAYLKTRELGPEDSTYYTLMELEFEDLWGLLLADGISAYQVDETENALQNFERMSVLKPKDTLGYQYAASVAEAVQKYPVALRNYRELVKIQPKELNYEKIITIQKDMLKDYQGAYQTIQEAKEKLGKVSDKIRNMEIDLLMATNRMEDAQRILKEAVYKEPKNGSLWLRKGMVHEELIKKEKMRRKPDEAQILVWKKGAIDAYKMTIKLEKDNILAYDACYNYAALLNNEATDYFDKAKELDPKNNSEQILNMEEKGMALVREALPLMEKALEINPRSRDALKALLNYYNNLEMSGKAEEVNAKLKELGY